MMIREGFWVYLLVMAGVTYLLRMLPMVLMKEKIKNRFVVSFLHYIPYTVLASMTVPAIFYATNLIPAIVGFVVAVICAYFKQSLVKVAAFSCVSVLVAELVMRVI
jgi:branched-subunit amino acid transport protein